jgi:predicted dehydrogenase
VDAPGIQRILKAGKEAARQNLKLAGGLNMRHSQATAEAIEQIHGGKIGDVITTWAYRLHGPVGFKPRQAGMNELGFQVSNYCNFTWLNGSFLLDWLIHNIDVGCWLKNDWPASVQGMGGRQVRTEPDQLFDHYAAEYSFGDGTRMETQGRHISGCFDFWGVFVQGATGCAVLGEGQAVSRIFKGHKADNANLIWRYKGPQVDSHQVELDLLFDAIRNDKPYNEAERCAKSCLTGIMGRMACETGKTITWEEALNSKQELAPGLENFNKDSHPPVLPDANGHYPVAMPGQTPFV